MKANKTNAARLLDAENIDYKLATYDVDEDNLSAVHVAETMEMDVNQLFKTLVLKGDKTNYFVCVIPGGEELDLKIAAKISGNKKCDLIPMKDLLSVTGYIRGACSPIGMKKKFPTYMDESCLDYDIICVSAGKRGLQIQIKPDDLITIESIKLAKLCQTIAI